MYAKQENKGKQVQPVFITIDPQRDGPAQVFFNPKPCSLFFNPKPCSLFRNPKPRRPERGDPNPKPQPKCP